LFASATEIPGFAFRIARYALYEREFAYSFKSVLSSLLISFVALQTLHVMSRQLSSLYSAGCYAFLLVSAFLASANELDHVLIPFPAPGASRR
jgi:hypothetical protein